MGMLAVRPCGGSLALLLCAVPLSANADMLELPIDASRKLQECFSEFRREAHIWFGISGWPSRFTLPREYTHLAKARADALGDSECEDQSLDAESDDFIWNLFDQASARQERCSEVGGRVWEYNLRLKEYGEYTGTSEHISSIISDELGPQELPLNMRNMLCVPTACEREHLRMVTLPDYISLSFFSDVGFLPEVPVAMVNLTELSHWKELHLDFAVAGMNNCGTTSIRRNLETHPDIAFTMPDEDPLLAERSEQWLLPPMWLIEEFNARRWPLDDPRPKLRGIHNPEIFRLPLARAVLRQHPHARLIVVVCDPLDRLEKDFFIYRSCEARRQGMHDDGSPCSEDVRDLLDMPEFIKEKRVVRHLKKLVMFPTRVIFLPQARLWPENAAKTFNFIADWFGVRRFPFGAAFPRYNSRGGERTRLCRDRPLFDELKSKLESEYAGLEQLLYAFGETEEFVSPLRISRCERSKDGFAKAASCDKFTPCAEAERRPFAFALESMEIRSVLQLVTTPEGLVDGARLRRALELLANWEPVPQAGGLSS